MNGLDDARLRDGQQVVVAPDIVRPVAETVAPVVGLGQVIPLNHRSHRAVENENALLEKRGKRFQHPLLYAG